MFDTTLADLGHGFAVALAPGNRFWCFVGVTIGNLVGVLPGMGVMSAVSILLPLTFGGEAVQHGGRPASGVHGQRPCPLERNCDARGRLSRNIQARRARHAGNAARALQGPWGG